MFQNNEKKGENDKFPPSLSINCDLISRILQNQ